MHLFHLFPRAHLCTTVAIFDPRLPLVLVLLLNNQQIHAKVNTDTLDIEFVKQMKCKMQYQNMKYKIQNIHAIKSMASSTKKKSMYKNDIKL
jgi:hypothetical protein